VPAIVPSASTNCTAGTSPWPGPESWSRRSTVRGVDSASAGDAAFAATWAQVCSFVELLVKVRLGEQLRGRRRHDDRDRHGERHQDGEAGTQRSFAPQCHSGSSRST
jgi:hypothetical protein